MYWYRIDLDHIDKLYTISGTSPLSPSELAEALTQGRYIHITNLVYRDSQRRFQRWQEWDPLVKDETWINPARVVSFQELSTEPKLEIS
ncbi:MAG: hypothetical protein QM758_03210 [Armatimonas sp.]